MTRYIVRAHFDSTAVTLSISGATPERALAKARRHRIGRKARAYSVVARKSGCVVLTFAVV